MTEPIAGRHAGRHFLVSGAGTGIGRAIALRLAAEGASLGLIARDAKRLEATRAAAEEPDRIRVRAADVRDRASVDAALEEFCADQGPLHGVVANAGIGGPNEEGPEDRFDELIATNLGGTYHTFRASQVRLAPGPDPRQLIAVSSILARIGVPGYTGYCASKAGILGLVRALAAEVAPENIHVNAVCPGWVDTAMAREGLEGMAAGMKVSFDEAHDIAMQAVPLGRMGKPVEVAGLVSYLLSPDSTGMTGQAVDMNCGAFMI